MLVEETVKEVVSLLAVSLKTVCADQEYLMEKLDIHTVAGRPHQVRRAAGPDGAVNKSPGA